MRHILAIVVGFTVTLLGFSGTAYAAPVQEFGPLNDRENPSEFERRPAGKEIGGLKVVETGLKGRVTGTYVRKVISGQPDKETGNVKLRPQSLSQVSGGALQAAGYPSGCRTIDQWITARTTSGYWIAYKWHQKKRWCYSRGRQYIKYIRAYATHIDSQHYWRKNFLVARGGFYDGRYGHVSFRQGKIQNCILYYGCIKVDYPWVKVWTRANGSYSVSKWYR